MSTTPASSALTRRDLLLAGSALMAVAAVGLPASQALATPADVDAAIKKATGGQAPKPGKVTLEVPELADNGATVPLAVKVDSPMTEKDFVKEIHIFADGNPRPTVMTAKLGPRAGKAEFSIRIRLAQSQNVQAVAIMSDGQAFMAKKEVKVTAGGC